MKLMRICCFVFFNLKIVVFYSVVAFEVTTLEQTDR